MKLLLTRSATLISTALLVLISSLYAAECQVTNAQDDEKQITQLDTVIRTGSVEARQQAVTKLLSITSEKASELLLKTLKDNLANKRGHNSWYASFPTGTAINFGHSENYLLVNALGNRKYEKALPTLQKMLEMHEKWLGVGKQAVAASIYLISNQPVKYFVDGELKIYPEPDHKPDETTIIGSLRIPSSGEAAWQENSLNSRIRELVRVLGDPAGPQGLLDSYYRILKEDIGRTTLMNLVTSDDLLVRPYAIEALGILGEKPSEIISVLTTALRDKDPRVRFRSVRALGHLLGSDKKPDDVTVMIAALKGALGDVEPEVRVTAAEQFRKYAFAHHANMDQQIKDVVPLLVAALEDRIDDVRRATASALGEIGPLTDRVVPALVQLLKSPELGDRETAVQALSGVSRFGDNEDRVRMKKVIARALLIAPDDPARSVRYEIAEGLGEIGPVAPGVLPALIKLTKDPSRGVRYGAARSLGRFEIERPRIVAALARMLGVEDEESEVLEAALRSLGDFGPEARSAAPAVRRLLRSEDPRIRGYAGYTLEKIDPPAQNSKR